MLTPLPEKILDEILAVLAKEDSFVFLETTKTAADNKQSLLFLKPIDRLTYKAGEPLEPFFQKAQSFLDKGYYLAGYLAYEFGYSLEPVLNKFIHIQEECTARNQSSSLLADLGIFPPPVIYNHQNNTFSNPIPAAEHKESLNSTDHFKITNITPSQPKEDYLEQITKIKEYIAAGDTYQVNYTLKLLFDFIGNPEALTRLYVAINR